MNCNAIGYILPEAMASLRDATRTPAVGIAIGYGNELRSDDGIGQRVAKALQLSNVKSIAVHQLTLELAEALANTDLAVFIDACLASENSQVQVESLLSNSCSVIAGHTALSSDSSPVRSLSVSLVGDSTRSGL